MDSILNPLAFVANSSIVYRLQSKPLSLAFKTCSLPTTTDVTYHRDQRHHATISRETKKKKKKRYTS